MKINEAEALAGVPRKTIRFYEEQGLLSPQRNRANGYRDYGEEEVEVLRKIKLLRKLGLPLAEIRQIQQGSLTLRDGLNRHAIVLNRERKRLEQSLAMTRTMAGRGDTYAALDAAAGLAEMETLEEGGTMFLNQQNNDQKPRMFRGAVASAVVMVVLMAAMIALLVWAEMVDPIPLPLMLICEAIPAAILIGVVAALVQRIQELKGDELDDADQY